jgi:AcrR family transcriptional regulator
MTSQSEVKGERRAPLSTDLVLQTAIRLADEGGLDSLSMRRLARELGVEVMSLYYYVARKDDVINGILDLVVQEMEPASEGPDWRVALRRSAISAHEVLERHRWACSLLMSPARVSRARMRYMEAMLGRLREAGLSAHLTDRAYHALDSHIIGSRLWEAGYEVGVEGLDDYAMAFLRALPVDEFPYLAEHVHEHLKQPSPDDPGDFAFGLDLILDGLERVLAGSETFLAERRP